ncbi:MAG: hypothetical protein IKJ39_01010 [Lachnospiraceae bacterium]|nr:hypothetical protein [Lachnospiraceae bacterium]
MWRWVIKDYFSNFSWYKISARMKGGNWFWVIYMFTIVPLVCRMFERWEYTAIYYLMMLPIGFCMASAALQKNRLSKIFYICPMEKTMRRAYVERKFLFSVLVSAFGGCVSTVLLLLLQLCHPVTAGVYFFNLLVISVFSDKVFIQTVEIPKDSAIRLETVESQGSTESVALLLSVIGTCGMGMVLSFGPSVESWCKWIFLGGAVLIILPLTIKGLTGWNAAVERALSYEVVKIKAKKVGGK